MRKLHGWAGFGMAALLGLAACGGSTGGSGSARHPIGDSAIKSAAVVARAPAFQRPLDAAPSPDGGVIYFLSTGDRGPSIVRIGGVGGAVTTVAEGAPLVNPTGVAVATNGDSVYIADQLAGASGAILVVPTSGTAKTPTTLAGTEGRSPRGLDVVREADADVVYFIGKEPSTGAPGLFKVPSGGGIVSTVASGAPFISPDSVVVTSHGDAFVTDQGSDIGHGSVYRVSGGTATPVLTGLHVGAPAGVTLVNADATLLVSSIDTATLSDQVLFLDLATGKTAAATKVIGANKNSSGGLHRAHDASVLAWADVSRSGRVYRVEPVANAARHA